MEGSSSQQRGDKYGGRGGGAAGGVKRESFYRDYCFGHYSD